MTPQRRAWIAAVAGFAAAVAGYFAFSGGEDAVIRAAFRQGAAAAETGDIQAIADLLDGDFHGRINLLASYSNNYLESNHDRRSSLDKDEAVELIERAIQGTRDRQVKINRLNIDIEGDSARVHCEFSVKAKLEAVVYNVPYKIKITASVEMEKREGQWRVIQSEIKDIDGEMAWF